MKDLKFILKNTARTKEYLVDLLEFYHFSIQVKLVWRYQDLNMVIGTK